MEKKSIEFIIADFNNIGGVEKVTQVLSEVLSKNYHVNIHSLYADNSDENKKDISFHSYNLKMPDIRNGILKKLLQQAYNILLLAFKIKVNNNKRKSSFFIFQGFYIACYMPALFLMRDKFIVCEHNTHKAPGRLSNIMRLVLYKIFTPKIIVLTDDDKLFYKSKGLKKVYKIHNPSPIKSPKKSHLENHLLVSIGRFTEQKRFDLMVETVAPVLSSNQSIKLLIQGEGPQKDIILKQIERHALEDQVRLVPPGNTKPTYMGGSIFLLTSHYEGLPMTLIEAISYGIPVIAFNCSPGISEIIIDGYNGFLIPMDNKTLFKSRVQLLLDNEKLYKKFAKNAILSSKKFNAKDIYEKWQKVLM